MSPTLVYKIQLNIFISAFTMGCTGGGAIIPICPSNNDTKPDKARIHHHHRMYILTIS